MATANKVHIIGIGDNGLDGLTAGARQLIEQAQLLVGAEAALAQVGTTRAERLALGNNLEDAVERLSKASDRKAVVLASGDPLFYGVARFLCDRLGKDRFEVVPHVSSMQLAFARVKESWEEAFLTNLANHPIEQVLDKIRVATKAGLFTSEQSPPSAVARTLLDHGLDYFSAYVCENLGSPDERVTQGELAEIATQQFAPLNVMILVRKPDVPDRPTDAAGHRIFGNPDEAFLQSKPKHGLLTPAEIRSIALAELDLGLRSIVWDIGAGSGSVSIEAAHLASSGTVYAIEMDAEEHTLIVANAERFRVSNVVPVLGRAPDAWKDLPHPDAVFVDGSGREVSRLVEMAFERLRPGGRLVTNAAGLESVASVHETLKRLTGDVKVLMINLARGTEQLERLRFEAANPVFLVSVVKAAVGAARKNSPRKDQS